MATKFEDIIDMALVSIQDYKLDDIYDKDTEAFKVITQSFLLRGLSEFHSCKTPLDYSIEGETFKNTLALDEINILADLWVLEWFKFHIQNVTQFENSMTPNDFKHHSKAENLKQKSEYADRLREQVKQKIVDYELRHINFNAFK